MKFFITLLVSAIFMFGGELRVASSYADAVAQAKKEDKRVFMMLSQYGCPACNYMKNTVLKNDEVGAALSKYIVVLVDIYDDSWNKKYRAFGTPTMYFLDKNENKIGRPIIGAPEIKDFLNVIREVEAKK